jgi:ribosomal protein L23
MGFSNRLSQISKSTDTESVSSDYETKAGIYTCTVKSVDESPQGHPGSPYLLFKMRTESNKMISAKLWVASDSDDADKANRKDNKIRKVFESLGVTIAGKSGGQLLADAVGTKAQFAFQEREYIAVEKDTNKPEIKTALNYYYCNKVGESITPLNESNCIQKLSPADERKYEQQLMMWQKQSKNTSSISSSKQVKRKEEEEQEEEEESDTPF